MSDLNYDQRKRIASLLLSADKVSLHICESYPGDKSETISNGELNDFVFITHTNHLELWVNTGYEI